MRSQTQIDSDLRSLEARVDKLELLTQTLQSRLSATEIRAEEAEARAAVAEARAENVRVTAKEQIEFLQAGRPKAEKRVWPS